MKKRFIKISFPFIALFCVYFLGPEAPKPDWNTSLPVVPDEPAKLEAYIAEKESQHTVKPDNEARIEWLDSIKTKTEYAVVYIHGFSASQMEGDPVHRRFAKKFGCNLYLPRLSDHGIDTTDALIYFTASRAWRSAKEDLAIGKKLGQKVILIGTSTGATLALKLAAEFPDDVYALINMSPNIAINHPAAFILNDPWGLQISRLVKGGKYNESTMSEERKKYWNAKYRLEAPVELEEMLEDGMTQETFRKIKQPSLTLYYYKNEQEQDPEVKVSAMLEMFDQLATPDSLKVKVAMPNAGAHVLGSPMTSKDVEGVYAEIEKFAIEKLALKPVQ